MAASAADGPQADPIGFDVTCVVATQSAMASGIAETKIALMSAVTYFSGRVDAELSGTELDRRFAEAATRLQGQPVGALLKQCGEFMQQRGKAWIDMGGRIQAREDAKHAS